MVSDVAFLLYDDFAAIDATGPADVFSTANDLARRKLYNLRYFSEHGIARASNGMTYQTERLEAWAGGEKSMLMVPGAAEEQITAGMSNKALVEWIRRVATNADRVCSVCSGAFLLARAGLLNGRRATTHWRGLDQLVAAFPKVLVERDVLFVEDRGVWTSAGVTAGIDMTLAILERDQGRPLAMRVAREMVLFLVRPGGQAQFSAPLQFQQRAATSALSSLPFWLEERLPEPISVADMAEAMSMSERNFHRRCVAAFALTPNVLLQRLRLERARVLLEDGALTLKEIARQCGLGDVSALGKCFRQHFGVTPGDYRTHFGKSAFATS